VDKVSKHEYVNRAFIGAIENARPDHDAESVGVWKMADKLVAEYKAEVCHTMISLSVGASGFDNDRYTMFEEDMKDDFKAFSAFCVYNVQNTPTVLFLVCP